MTRQEGESFQSKLQPAYDKRALTYAILGWLMLPIVIIYIFVTKDKPDTASVLTKIIFFEMRIACIAASIYALICSSRSKRLGSNSRQRKAGKTIAIINLINYFVPIVPVVVFQVIFALVAVIFFRK